MAPRTPHHQLSTPQPQDVPAIGSETRTKTEIAISVLSRYIPGITRIVSVCSVCHLYVGQMPEDGEFQWGDKQLYGPLFLVATPPTPHPRNPNAPILPGDEDYHLIILSRTCIKSYHWNLLSTDTVDSSDDQYIMLGVKSGRSFLDDWELDDTMCFGLWPFKEKGEDTDERPESKQLRQKTERLRQEFADTLMECVRKAEERGNRRVPPPQGENMMASAGNGNGNGAPLIGGVSILHRVFPNNLQQQPPQEQQQPQRLQTPQQKPQFQNSPRQQSLLDILRLPTAQTSTTPQVYHAPPTLPYPQQPQNIQHLQYPQHQHYPQPQYSQYPQHVQPQQSHQASQYAQYSQQAYVQPTQYPQSTQAPITGQSYRSAGPMVPHATLPNPANQLDFLFSKAKMEQQRTGEQNS
ncbi:hypothetical protein BZA77DRAFT_290157 [Pyronema omphalodes]|nr:hypothetical protein BZA77DRAFT_290157 [Pyronema omphalodes]